MSTIPRFSSGLLVIETVQPFPHVLEADCGKARTASRARSGCCKVFQVNVLQILTRPFTGPRVLWCSRLCQTLAPKFSSALPKGGRALCSLAGKQERLSKNFNRGVDTKATLCILNKASTGQAPPQSGRV